MADDELIQKFVDLHAQTIQFLNEEKLKDAKQRYLEVVEAYHSIDKSQLERFHKELAYDQVTALFKQVNETKERIQVPYHLIVAAVLIISFSVLIFLKPSIVGLAGFEDLIRQPTDIVFTQSQVKEVSLSDRPLTLSASGEFYGKAKLFLKQGEKFELIFDSEKNNGTTFTEICEETCEINANSNVIELFAEVSEGSRLIVKELSYKIQSKDNSAPAWSGTRTFYGYSGKQITIDLEQYFTDADNDDLVYLSTTTEGLELTVQNSKVTITPASTGTKSVTFIASDLLEVTKIPVAIEVS